MLKNNFLTMKLQNTIALSVLLTTLGCVSQKRFETSPPFRISNPVVKRIIPGQELSQQQLELRMIWEQIVTQEVLPDSIYFRGLSAKSFIDAEDNTIMLKALFTLRNRVKEDMVMDANANAEVGNQPPYLLPAPMPIPVELADNQAVLSYTIKGKKAIHYYKIDGIVEKTPVIRPSKPHR
jgi:hypothetical protein